MLYVILAASYLLGSISFAIVAGYLVTGEDIRKKGSGNAGTTNVFRVLGWKVAVPVLFADFFKSFLPVYFAPALLLSMTEKPLFLMAFQIAILVFVEFGHVFPLWFRFRGGKGMATAAGGISVLFPPAVPVCLVIFISVMILSRYVSLASLITAWSLPILYGVIAYFWDIEFSFLKLIFFLAIAAAITISHRANIQRILAGRESKIQLGRQKK